jgi:suppressor of G2 allele of SKP1
VEESEYSSATTFYSSAATTLEQALHDALIGQASAAVAADDCAQAFSAASRAAALCPESGLAWYWQGHASIKDGDRVRARRAFQRAADVERDLALKASYIDWVRRAKEEADEPMPAGDAAGSAPTGQGTDVRSYSKRDEGPGGEAETATAIPTLDGSEARMEWYQSNAYVTIDVYAKNVDKNASSVDISESQLKARLARPENPDYVLAHDLYGPVVPAESGWSASKFKAEIRLKKAPGSGDWKSLAATGLERSASERARISGEQKVSAVVRSQKDWDAIADKELEGDKDDDGPMGIFKTIYAGADEDARRAMMKSYTESGGKVLSTDWSDVKQRKVEYKEDSDRS